MTGQDFFFRVRGTSFHTYSPLLTFFLCFIVLFQSCCSHARVFGKTLVHEFPFPIAILNGTCSLRAPMLVLLSSGTCLLSKTKLQTTNKTLHLVAAPPSPLLVQLAPIPCPRLLASINNDVSLLFFAYFHLKPAGPFSHCYIFLELNLYPSSSASLYHDGDAWVTRHYSNLMFNHSCYSYLHTFISDDERSSSSLCTFKNKLRQLYLSLIVS